MGIFAILESERLPNLKRLNLVGADLTDRAAAKLASLPGLARLEELAIGPWDYQESPLGDPTARALAECPHREHIKKLDLRLDDLRAETVAALRRRFGNRVKLRR